MIPEMRKMRRNERNQRTHWSYEKLWHFWIKN